MLRERSDTTRVSDAVIGSGPCCCCAVARPAVDVVIVLAHLVAAALTTAGGLLTTASTSGSLGARLLCNAVAYQHSKAVA